MNPNLPNSTHKRLLQLHLPEFTSSTSANINDSFMTADGTGNDSTQFFSMLEDSTSETILENSTFNNLDEHGLTFTNDISDIGDDNDEEANKGTMVQDLVIFKSPLSSRLYGLQVSQDEEGNLQKYQYEVVESENGEYVSIPGTIEVVSYETTPASVISKIENHQTQLALMTSVENTANNNDSTTHSDNSQEAFAKEASEWLDVEINIRDYESSANNSTEQSENDGSKGIQTDLDHQENLQISLDDPNSNDNSHGDTEHAKLDGEDYSDDYLAETNAEDALAEHFITEDSSECITNVDQVDRVGNKTPIKECILESALKCIYSPIKSDSNNVELYFQEETEEVDEPDTEIVHLQHVRYQSGTGHRTIAVYPICKQELKATRQQMVANVNTAPLKSLNSLKRQHGNEIATVVSAQKENLVLQTARPSNSSLVNPTKRIIRKVDVAIKKSSKAANADREKKKTVPSWNVNNMISETKIIEAPVRQERLPRKQKIKLMDRVGEELEFQRVTVSANGTIKTLRGIPKSNKRSTAYFYVSDEDDEAVNTLQQNTQKQGVKIVISSNSEEDKHPNTTNEQIAGIDIDVPKAEQMGNVEDKSDDQCLKCSKSFPDLESLKTHMHVHTIEEAKKECKEDDAKSKHECKVCSEKFINAFLCNKHEKLHLAKLKTECNICKKLFKNAMELNTHKKTHSTSGSALSIMMKRRTLPRSCSVHNTSSKSEPNGAITKGNVETSEAEITDDRKLDKRVQDKRDHRKNRLSISASRKSIVPPRNSSVAANTRKSMMPVLTRQSALLTNTTRRSVAPAKLGSSSVPSPRRSVLSKTMGPPIGQPIRTKPTASATTPPKPTNSNRAAKTFKCLSCSAVFQNKVLLDNHIISKCVKTPRRLSKSNTAMPLRSTSAHSSEAKSISDLDKIDRTKSQSTSTLNNIKNVSVSRKTMGKFTPTSKSTLSLEPTSNTKKKVPLSARHRIPTNAGIPLNARMKGPFMNLKRKLMENDESEDEWCEEK